MSDTRNAKPKVPDGDLLIHVGDLTQSGGFQEVSEMLEWLRSLPHPHKVIVAGHHDFALRSKEKLHLGGITYLEESTTRIKLDNGRILNIYGSPWSQESCGQAFEYFPHQDLWTNNSPCEADVFISHSPPKYHLDVDGYGEQRLLKELWRIRPSLHVFGQVHGGYGLDVLTYDDFNLAYENIRRKTGGIGALFTMLRSYMAYMLSSKTARNKIPRTILVNAAIVGGLRDEERRQPIVVSI